MQAVDTNVLVRLLVRDDVRQADAAEKFVAGGAWVSQLVLAETLWILDAVFKLGPLKIARAVEMLLAHRTVTLQDSDLISEALARYRRQPKLGFTDCLVLESARHAGHMPLGTFDKRLAAQSGAVLISS